MHMYQYVPSWQRTGRAPGSETEVQLSPIGGGAFANPTQVQEMTWQAQANATETKPEQRSKRHG